MGRRPLGEAAMTDAVRQKLRRARLKAQGLVLEYVNTDTRGDYYSVEIRLAGAVRRLFGKGILPEEFREAIVAEALSVVPLKNRVDYLFMEKQLHEYLNREDGEHDEEHAEKYK
ncbi:MAG: hypothetical protein LBV76_05455 [Deltaproteobacteria bacterium]|jgi:hypothetical protein|nr:hypothetical protein [Deltaproteobacteria bacterium]